MKSILRGLVIVLAVVEMSSAQKSPAKFGVIPMDDLKMTKYEKDTTAEAVVLLDYGDAAMAFYTSTVKLNFERHVRIKILNKEGLNWADVAIPLYKSGNSGENVTGFKASTWNLENGRLVETEVSKSSMFKEKVNKYWDQQKFTFPNVREGSILEYTYTISSEFIFNFPDWKFQYTIPVRHSEFWALIPDFCVYQKYMQGYETVGYDVKPKSTADYLAQAHHWVAKDMPAFVAEPYMTCDDDYISQIKFAVSHLNFPGRPSIEIMGSWNKLVSNLNESEMFGKAITGNGFLKKIVEEITAGLTDDKAKVKAIYNYVKSNVAYSGVEDYYADNLKKVLENKKGSSGDINILLASMLDKANIKTDMILLSTRDHGFIRQAYPMSKQMNYVVVRVTLPDSQPLLDATEKYLPMEFLPERCLNGEGLIVSKINRGWVNLETKGKAKKVTSAELLLEADGAIKGKVDYALHGYDANDCRREYFKDGEEKHFQELQAQLGWEISQAILENATDIEKPAIQKHQVVIPSHASVAGDQIYMNPFVSDLLKENPFKSEQREYPVDFGRPIERMYLGKITIPDGYVADEIPANRIFVLPNNAAKFVYSVNVTGNVISVVSNLQINKSLFVQTEYPDLREFYNQIVAKQNEQIVLKKKL